MVKESNKTLYGCERQDKVSVNETWKGLAGK